LTNLKNEKSFLAGMNWATFNNKKKEINKSKVWFHFRGCGHNGGNERNCARVRKDEGDAREIVGMKCTSDF
jgi:hypothetical protein